MGYLDDVEALVMDQVPLGDDLAMFVDGVLLDKAERSDDGIAKESNRITWENELPAMQDLFLEHVGEGCFIVDCRLIVSVGQISFEVCKSFKVIDGLEWILDTR